MKMSKMMGMLALIACFAFSANSYAQCGATEITLEVWNTTNCDANFTVTLNNGDVYNWVVAPNGNALTCVDDQLYILSGQVDLVGGGSVTLGSSGTAIVGATVAACAGYPNPPNAYALGHGMCCPGLNGGLTVQVD